jgi:hypothetical protein
MKTKHNIQSTSLGTFQDNLLGVPYELLLIASAADLSGELKSVLTQKGINPADYNSHESASWNKKDEVVSENPPAEIYEYQNFFVLENIEGQLILFDGFRRLLWYTPPTTPILVRLYKQSDLNDQQILSLLVSLNHFKFFGGQEYHERGFSLLLKTVFDLDITKFKRAFDAYLSSDEIKNSYSLSGKRGAAKNNEIKNRIVNPYFIDDMRFLEKLRASKYMCDQFVGALTFQERQRSGKGLDFDGFVSIADKHSVLQALLEKYAKIGTDNSAKSQDVVNKIIEIYDNIFVQMAGGVIEKSYAEKIQECKDLVAKLKKDKGLTKMTGAGNCYLIEREIIKRIAKGEVPEFACVVHPIKGKPWGSNPIELSYKILDDVKYLGMTEPKIFKSAELIIGIELNGRKHPIQHNYGGHHSYGKKYTRLGSYDIDLFVKIPAAEIPKKN